MLWWIFHLWLVIVCVSQCVCVHACTICDNKISLFMSSQSWYHGGVLLQFRHSTLVGVASFADIVVQVSMISYNIVIECFYLFVPIPMRQDD